MWSEWARQPLASCNIMILWFNWSGSLFWALAGLVGKFLAAAPRPTAPATGAQPQDGGNSRPAALQYPVSPSPSSPYSPPAPGSTRDLIQDP